MKKLNSKKVICKFRDSCSELKCGHHTEHNHTKDCDTWCKNEWHTSATCISIDNMKLIRELEVKNSKPKVRQGFFF